MTVNRFEVAINNKATMLIDKNAMSHFFEGFNINIFFNSKEVNKFFSNRIVKVIINGVTIKNILCNVKENKIIK